mmetsp:Transcript_18225/g.21078  ORF Transcript_18225/g.21078 Transcript_18225/m.21078 type:complete len:465 (+) Transcript_18225:136-1530(+)
MVRIAHVSTAMKNQLLLPLQLPLPLLLLTCFAFIPFITPFSIHSNLLHRITMDCLTISGTPFKIWHHHHKQHKHSSFHPLFARKQKMNKYAKFSKVDQGNQSENNNNSTTTTTTTGRNLDPFEALLAESKEKNKNLEKEIAKSKNKKEVMDEETSQKLKSQKRERNKRLFPDTKMIDPYDPVTYGYTELGTILGPHGVFGLLKVAAVTDFPERLCKPGIRHLKAPNRRSPREIRIIEGRHAMKDEYLVKLEHISDRNEAQKLRGSVLYARQEERPEEMDENEYLISDLVGLEVRLVTGYGDDNYDDDNYDNDDDNNDNDDDNHDDDDFVVDKESNEYISDMNLEQHDIETEGIIHEQTNKSTVNDTLGGKFVGIVGGVVLGEEMCSIPGLGQDLIEIILPRGKTGSPSWRDELVLIPFVPSIVPTVDFEKQILYINPPGGLLDLTYIKEEKIRIKGYLPEKSSY